VNRLWKNVFLRILLFHVNPDIERIKFDINEIE